MQSDRPFTIMLVEDDAGHAILIEKNLRRAGIVDPIVAFTDGRAALDFLEGRTAGGADSEPPPFIVLLDLNLPGTDGTAVLRAIKSDERTRSIPVVVLTTSDNPQEIERCYALGCNLYIVKPADAGDFSDTLRRLSLFLSIVKNPGGRGHHG